MNGRHRRGYIALVFATATLIAASIFLYRIRPLAGISFGSTAIALAVLAHLGILGGCRRPARCVASATDKSP